MTCTGCQAKVQAQLSKVNGVNNVSIDLPKGEASIEMAKHIPTQDLQAALKDYPKYQLTESLVVPKAKAFLVEDEKRSWRETYKPILLVFGYILGVTLLVEYSNGGFYWMGWMNYFMAGFFLVFSFFKLLDLQGFADSYSTYDIIAKRWKTWGFIYVFIELLLGISFLLQINPLLTNGVAFVVMSISIIGVLLSVLSKRIIRCACLGSVFNLPMSTITIVEDALMIVMSATMILNLV
jgi:copper chaperone CopZ